MLDKLMFWRKKEEAPVRVPIRAQAPAAAAPKPQPQAAAEMPIVQGVLTDIDLGIEGADATGDKAKVHWAAGGTDIDIKGNLLTAEGGKIDVTPQIREYIALTDGGQIFVSKSHENHVVVKSLIKKAEAMGHAFTEPHVVDFLTISLIYQLRGKSIGRAAANDSTQTQRSIMRIIEEAVKLGGSDIHFVMNAKTAKLRVRVDGALQDLREVLRDEAEALMATAFTMADASDASYQPYEYQGARITRNDKIELPELLQAVRLQWNPMVGGRYLVMRLLYSAKNNTNDIDKLGYDPEHLRQINFMRIRPQGINVVSGPTGSGKSTTLKNCLDRLIFERRGEVNVITVEDPPEYVIEGAQQMPVTNANKGEERKEKFQQAINAAMRSDPDILMIGEVRDSESAKLAFEAAMTGHQVWTSLHANDAIGIIDRLRDMGVDLYKLTDPRILTGMISQRLLRLLCKCKIPLTDVIGLPEHDEDQVGRIMTFLENAGVTPDTVFVRGPGCEICKTKRPGYIGRTVAAEAILPDQIFLDHIKKGDKVAARKYWLEDKGGMTMLAHAARKMLAGNVSPFDIESTVDPLEFEPYMTKFFTAAQKAA